jgi:hypothetical protein
MQMLPQIMEMPDAAAALAKAALADDTGAALNGAIKEMRPCRRQRSSVLPARTSETVFARLGAMSR